MMKSDKYWGSVCREYVSTQVSNNAQFLTIFPHTLTAAARILQCGGSLLTPAESWWVSQQPPEVKYDNKEYEAPENTKGITKLQDILCQFTCRGLLN